MDFLGNPSLGDLAIDYLGREAPLAFEDPPALPTGGAVKPSAGPETTSGGGMAPPGGEDSAPPAKGDDGLNLGPALGAAELFRKILRDAGLKPEGAEELFKMKGAFSESSAPILEPENFSLTGQELTPVEAMVADSGLSLLPESLPFGDSMNFTPPLRGGESFLEGAGGIPSEGLSLSGAGETAAEGLVRDSALSLTAGQEQALLSQLGAYAQYIPYVIAALNVGQTLTGDMQEDQKLLATAALIGNLAASLGISGAAMGAGASAGMAAGIAAPVAMGLGFTLEHFLDMMQDIPHEVREKLDVMKREGENVAPYYQMIDEATTLDQLMNTLIGFSSQYVGGNEGVRMPFIPRVGDKFVGTPNELYPTVTREELLANLDQFSIRPQLGVSEEYLAPWQTALTDLARGRLDLFRRAQEGDPTALAALSLLDRRVGAQKRSRAMKERIRKMEEDERIASVPVGGDGGTA